MAAALLVPSLVRIHILASSGDVLALVQPVARFEGLIIGSMMAAGATNRAGWYQLMVRRKGRVFGIAAVGVASMLAAGQVANDWFESWGILVFDLSLGLTLPFLSNLTRPRHGRRLPQLVIAYLSELTYPVSADSSAGVAPTALIGTEQPGQRAR